MRMPLPLAAFVLVVATAFALPAEAQRGSVTPMGRTFGLGLQLGAPTSITGKFMVAGDQGVVVGVGGGIGYDFSLSLHADYLWHPAVFATFPPASFSFYVGGGLWLALSDARGRWGWYDYRYYPGVPFGLGVRIPIGVNMAFREIPIELYLEGVPTVAVFPHIGFGIGASIGARFYF